MPRKKQESPAVRWALTYFNHPADWRSSVVPLIDRVAKAYVIGLETCPTTKRLHLQGYVEFIGACNKGFRMTALKEMFDKSIHWEKAKKNAYVNAKYCSKDGDFVCKNLNIKEMTLATIDWDILKPWQRAISALFAASEDPRFGRNIYWFWEPHGNLGKSILSAHLVDHRGAIMVGGRRSDALCAVATFVKTKGHGPRMVIFDIPRANHAGVSYAAIESIKNGLFFSGKYESGMVRFNRPHIAVFSNYPPVPGDLSHDRWKICCLSRHIKLLDELRGKVAVRH